jgi:dTMP kinase
VNNGLPECQARVLDPIALNLLFQSNRWERKAFIEEHLKAGCNLVCDRYSFSGLAYAIANVHNSSLSDTIFLV